MINTKSLIISIISFLFLQFTAPGVFASINKDDEPSVVIHDTIAAPGELMLQIDALNFVGDNGQVAAITLRIEIDTMLLKFMNIQNMTLPGSWIANYNIYQNEITIIYTAPFGVGNDINGKLLDLNLNYYGGFPADLHFKAGCEISNVNLITIQNIVYEDGIINQVASEGTVSQDSVVGYYNQSFDMPVMAEGVGYDMVTQFDLRIDYDTNKLVYEGFSSSLLTGVSVKDSNSVLSVDWQSDTSTIDLTTLDTLLYLQFKFVGDTNTTTEFLPGSRVYNNDVLVASDFVDGVINVKLIVDLINNPDTAGTTTGQGYYFINDTVTVTAIPAEGFHFLNWTENGNVISSDSIYTFVKQNSNDTLVANYEANPYEITVVISPDNSGEVLGAGVYLYGDTVELIAIPAEGYTFYHWMFGGGIVSEDSIYTFVMPDYNMELIAVFRVLVFNVSVASNNFNFGTVQGGGEFNYGDTAVVIATPLPEYKFVVWTEEGQAVSYDSAYSFVVYSNRNLVANFQYDSDCSAPVGLSVSNLSETEAELFWLSSGNEAEWDLLWGESGFDTINSGELVVGLTEMNYLLENLDPGTSYDFYVRAVCDDGIYSSWAGPKTFSTWFVGIKFQNNKKAILVFPNPANDKLNFVYNNYTGKISYRIINPVGLIESDGELFGKNHFTINLEGLPSGIYILQLFTDNVLITECFVKK